jgi:hypothetical protein
LSRIVWSARSLLCTLQAPFNPEGIEYFSAGLRGTSYPGSPQPRPSTLKELPKIKISRIEPMNLIEGTSSVVGRSVTALPFGAFRFGTARLKDWFWSSTDVLFGDAACAVFPLGRLVLQGDDRAQGGWQVQ